MTLFVFKAQPTGDEPVQDLDLRAVTEFPDDGQAAANHDVDAKFVVSALLASLPGATVDAVLALLLTHRASQLRVRWPS